MEIPIQCQATYDFVCPARKTRAELLAAPERNSVIAKELKVIGAVEVKMPPVGMRVDFKVAPIGYAQRVREHIAGI